MKRAAAFVEGQFEKSDVPSRRIAFGWRLLAMAAAWFIILRPLFLKGAYRDMGVVRDLFIPYISANALAKGMKLHLQFHSAFGWIYHYYYYCLTSLSEKPGAYVRFTDVFYLSMVLPAVLVTVLYCVSFYLSPEGKRFSFWTALFALSLCATPRYTGHLIQIPVSPTWYGIYDNYLMGLIVAQCAVSLGWWRFLTQTGGAPPASAFRFFCLFQAAFIYVMLNFKINYGIASCGIASLPFFFFSKRDMCRYACYLSGIFLGATLLTAMAGYSYPGYLHDLMDAVAAHRESPLRIISPMFFFCAGLFVLACALQLISGETARKGVRGAWRHVRAVLFAGALSASSWVISAGSFRFISMYVFFMAAVFIEAVTEGNMLHGESARRYASSARFFMGFVIVLNLIGCMNINEQGPVNRGKEQVVRMGDVSTGRFLEMQVAKRYYANVVKQLDIAALPPAKLLQVSLSLNLLSGMIPFSDSDYYDSVMQSLAEARRLRLKPDEDALMIGFADYFQVFTRTRMVPSYYHWLHIGVTMSLAETWRVIGEYADRASFVVTPVVTMGWQDYGALSCMFLLENKKDGYPYKIERITPYNIFWARDEILARNGISPVPLSLKEKNRAERLCVRKVSQPDYVYAVFGGLNWMGYTELIKTFGLQDLPQDVAVLLAARRQSEADAGLNMDSEDVKKMDNDKHTLLRTLAPKVTPDLVLALSRVSRPEAVARNIDATPEKEIVVMPVIHAYSRPEQHEVNCAFFQRNNRRKDYAIFNVTPYNIFWGRRDFMREAGLKPMNNDVRLAPRIAKTCSAAPDAWKAGGGQ
ncbi:MAG: hypothetical protein GC185_10800 [Alphaproteobacteria bacterium]|nr:hypothetical protein [Alphaproteobacteria bacterium]